MNFMRHEAYHGPKKCSTHGICSTKKKELLNIYVSLQFTVFPVKNVEKKYPLKNPHNQPVEPEVGTPKKEVLDHMQYATTARKQESTG